MPARPRPLTLLPALAVLLTACATTSAPPRRDAERPPAAPGVAANAVRVQMEGFAGGPGFRLPDDLRGRPLVLNVWASWCGPCRTEMPAFQTVWLHAKDKVGFLGLDETDELGAARRFVAETRVTYPLAADPHGQAAARLGVVGLPVTLFISADGVLRGRRVGAMEAQDLRAAIRTYLKVTVP
ncbi:MAG TPA: TlpA disulfide reductase family protein [Actinomycetes bacterium]|nr:TlpA disulfide reductase family protein [Actinomycetes bacterium]